MNYNKKTVRDFDPHGKKVLLRCDFNVPQNKETGEITSDKRIVAALPTIKYLLENGAAVIACSHLGKPKGEWKESLTLAPVAKRLSELLGMDIGPKTVELYCEAVKGAGTIVWNGPMGVFEFPAFANGTWKMAEAVANSGAVTIIGGGDSASAVEKSGQADKITHISTGGGASLEFLEGLELPGVACLLDK